MKKILVLLVLSVGLMAGCISGDCKNGKGTYTWPNGDKYIGNWKDDKADGKGTIIWANDDKYVGEFKDNDRTGQGTFTRSDGSQYSGKFEKGKIIDKSFIKKLKGYLVSDLVIPMKEYDDILYKGTYIELNMKNKTIIIPKGYENITLKKFPKLSVPADKREITIIPTVIKTIRDKKIIGFKIETNIKLETIKCDDKELVLTTKTNYTYISKPRAVRAKYSLKLITKKGAVLVYDCDENSCHSRKKDEL